MWIYSMNNRTKLCTPLKQERKYAYIMGDYNTNLLNHDAHPLTGDFLNMIYTNRFIPLITRPTWSVGNTNTLIDNIPTNNIDELKNAVQGIFVTDVTIIRFFIWIGV